MPALDPTHFTPPGPGVWELETAHAARPITRLGETASNPSFVAGLADALDRYGSLIAELRFSTINRFDYSQPRMVGEPAGGGGPPPKPLLWLMMRLHPAIRRQRKKADAAFQAKLWRDDLRRWDEEDKPRSNQRHRQLGAVDLHALADRDLAAHVEACIDQWKAMAHQHGYYSVAAMLPLGDFLTHAERWTGLAPEALLPIFQGDSPASSGWVPEADPLLAAIEADPAAAAALANGSDPAGVLASLADHPTIGPHYRDYVAVIGPRVVGYDVGDHAAIETPGLILDGLRALRTLDQQAARQAGERHAREAREQTPPQHRPEFDALLREARLTYRLRDERGLFSDSVAVGLLRAALLEVGRRAAEAGLLLDAEHAVEADPTEIRRLISGDEAATSGLASALADRFQFRVSHTTDDAPRFLGGGPPPEPPSFDILPAGGLRRGMAAFASMLDLVFDPPQESSSDGLITGRPAGVGVHEGIARIVHQPSDFERIGLGDVIVARATSPTYNVVLGRVGAIVTDHGGVLSHAAIVAREFGIPAVVGCGDATSAIPDGARVRVDAQAGTVTLIR